MRKIKSTIMIFSGLLCAFSLFLFTYDEKTKNDIDEMVFSLETKNDDKNNYSYVVPVVNRKAIKTTEKYVEEDESKIKNVKAEEINIDNTLVSEVSLTNEEPEDVKEATVVLEGDSLSENKDTENEISNDKSEVLLEDKGQIVSLSNNANLETKKETTSTTALETKEETTSTTALETKEETTSTTALETKEEILVTVPLKNGFVNEDNKTYYYENDVKVTGLKIIDGVNHYFAPNGTYLGTNNVKIIDVSHHQGKINWEDIKNSAEIYGVIIRAGYWNTLDREFSNNINEVKRLNIPYGIYFYSYASSVNGAKIEGEFARKVISDYDLNPTLGIYYDIESWNTGTSSSDSISKSMYDAITGAFVNKVKEAVGDKYKVKLYSGRWYAMNRLGSESKALVDWVAEYNSTCKYDGSYSLWQYTSSGSVPGITGRVDISYLK